MIGMVRRFALWLGGLIRDDSGIIALKFAFIGPAVIVLAVGAVDLMAVRAADDRLQAIADAGALAGASSLGLATDGAEAKARASAFVAASMSEWENAPEHTAEYAVVDRMGQRALSVAIKAQRPSFFVNLLPPGGWKFRADAVASSVGLVPLCVLVTGTKGSKLLNIKDSSSMRAPACLVHSNRDVVVEGGRLQAAMVQSVTGATGSISPSPSEGAAAVADPFVSLNLERSKLRLVCSVVDLANNIKVSSGYHRIAPGRHCGGIEAIGTAQIVLEPGEHYFMKGSLKIVENARLTGEDVVLIFDEESKFEFKDQAMVSLEGRRTGDFSGIVMTTTRSNQQNFLISADNVDSLLGVIYVPSARMIVEGKSEVARDSAWTVIVASQVEMKGSPSLFINANYSASAVPVPSGVGPRAGGSMLIQ